jgi:hypothetical protein
MWFINQLLPGSPSDRIFHDRRPACGLVRAGLGPNARVGGEGCCGRRATEAEKRPWGWMDAGMDAGWRADAWGWGRSAGKGAVAMIAGAGYAHRTLYSSRHLSRYPLERGSLLCGGVVFPALGASGSVARCQLDQFRRCFASSTPFYPYRIALILAQNRV